MKSLNANPAPSHCLHGSAALVLVLCGLILASGCRKSDSGTHPSSVEDSASAAKSDPVKTAEVVTDVPQSTDAILKAMVAAYQTAQNYSDKGTVSIRGTKAGKPMDDQPVDYTMAFERPNKLRLAVFRGAVISDGNQWHAFVQHIPGQIVERKAPARITPAEIFSDAMLMDAITQGPTMGVSWLPVQALLLLADDPLKTLLYGVQKTESLAPTPLNGNLCDRVAITRADGTAVLWIDRQSRILRRLELPIDAINRDAQAQQAKIEAIVADFHDAQFDAKIDSRAFAIEVPKDVQAVPFLVTPAHMLLSKPSPDFAFTALDGKRIDRKSLEGTIAVLGMWSSGGDGQVNPSPMVLGAMERVAKKYKDNAKVSFLAVHVDPAETPDENLKAMAAELHPTIPIARDPNYDAGMKLGLRQVPAYYILDPNGVIEDFYFGFDKNLEDGLAGKIESLLAGKSVSQDTVALAKEQHDQHVAELAKYVASELYLQPGTEPPKVEIAAATQPKTFSLAPLWKSADVKAPGNLLVVPHADGVARLLVIESAKSVIEIGPDGKLSATHPLEIDEKEVITFLRTAVDGSGKRYYAASGLVQPRVHVFDENWKRVSHYPANAIEEGQTHAGIADAQLADLDGDGKLELVVGYFGAVGVEIASLDGNRLMRNRELANVSRLVVLGRDQSGNRSLLCAADGVLVRLDSKLDRLDDIKLNRMVNWVAVDDLDAGQKSDICCLCPTDAFAQVAVGTNARGQELWDHVLPQGMFERPVEQVLTGRLFSDGPGLWILLGADGSVRFLDSTGKLVDQFNQGASLAGLAIMPIDGKPALIVATKESLEAYRMAK